MAFKVCLFLLFYNDANEPLRISVPVCVPPSQEKVLRMMYVWALCRDQEELNPYAAWRLLDISASSTEQIL